MSLSYNCSKNSPFIRFQYRNGGYTRVKPIGYRHGDAAKMSVIEYIRYDKIEIFGFLFLFKDGLPFQG